MQRGVAGAGQAGESLVDLYIWITLVEVGVVVFSGHPGGHGVPNFVGLGFESLTLDETAQGLGVAEHLFHAG